MLAHLAVVEHELFLEERARHGEHRHDHHHAQRQLPVQDEHHDDGEHEVRNVPHALHHAPGERARDAVGIRDHTRMDVADAVLVEIGERERLKMVKRRAAQVAPDIELRLARAVGGNVVRYGLHDHDQQIQRNEHADALHGLVCDKVVDGVLLEQRDDDIHAACHEPHQDHPEKQLCIALQIREELRNAEPGKTLTVLLLHAVSSSPMDICIS